VGQLATTREQQTRHGAYLILSLHLPHAGQAVGAAIGILLLDLATDRLHVKTLSRFPAPSPEDREILTAILTELDDRAAVEGGEALLGWLEDGWSHALRVSERRTAMMSRPETLLDQLFRNHVEASAALSSDSPAPKDTITFMPSTANLPPQRVIPFYPMRIAAGLFQGDMEVEAAAWVPLPTGVPASAGIADPNAAIAAESARGGYFVARITGHSMEPRVPDGSFCLFRAQPHGSREGKLLLVQKHGASERGGEYTIKRYHSEKAVLPMGSVEEFDDAPEWRHSRVRLISLNPEYPSWDLEADQCEVIAEFVRVLENEEVPPDLRTLDA